MDSRARIADEAHNHSDEYRRRVYGKYVTARNQTLAPSVLQGLRPRAAHLGKLIQSHFPTDRGATILDLGCGHGALIYFARQAGYRNIMGVDRSPQQVVAAQELGIDGVCQGDLVEVIGSVRDASLDAVVTFDVIEHFRKDELIGFIDQIMRALRTNGRWIIHAPNGESPFGSRMRYWDFTHEMAFTRESISQLLLSSGFTRVDCYEDGPVAHGTASTARWLLWKAIRLSLRSFLAVETGDTAASAIFSQNLIAVAIK